MLFLNPYYVREMPSPFAQVYDVKIKQLVQKNNLVKCPECDGIVRDSYTTKELLILKKGMLPDVLYTNDLYVSERFRLAWECEKLKGIESFVCVDTVRMLGRKEAITDKYYLVVPSVPNIQLDVVKSRCVSSSAIINDSDAYLEDIHKRSVICETCGRVQLRRRSGAVWEPSWSFPHSWIIRGNIENDISTLTNAFNSFGACYILSEEFIEFIQRNKLTNVYALTEAELRLVQENVCKGNTPVFKPVYGNPDEILMPSPKSKKDWKETDCGRIKCNFGKFIVRDVLDDEEEFGVQIQAKEGLWQVQTMVEASQSKRTKYALLRHEESNSLPSVEIGTLSIDGGALYLRACGKDKRSEKRIKDGLAEMGQSTILEGIENIGVSTRRSIAAAFLLAETGDGRYKVYVDNSDEASAIRIELGTVERNKM